MVTRLAQLQDAGVFEDAHSALAKAYVTSRNTLIVGRSITGLSAFVRGAVSLRA